MKKFSLFFLSLVNFYNSQIFSTLILRNRFIYFNASDDKSLIDLKNISSDKTILQSQLMLAIIEGDIDEFENLADKNNIDDEDIYGNTALMYAAVNCQDEIIAHILKNFDYVRLPFNKWYQSALTLAYQVNCLDVVEVITYLLPDEIMNEFEFLITNFVKEIKMKHLHAAKNIKKNIDLIFNNNRSMQSKMTDLVQTILWPAFPGKVNWQQLFDSCIV
ncbi:hypothetical protein A3F66_05250 [candidate division TM6 bacterium RIFCSPHIGHO2_12_FULL_32_22]|nr:MAG: hypothetical protein A3F66_05250 [candidate division TM6 bacterium RIFCSPHIGHO2_12_FULL_32_22]